MKYQGFETANPAAPNHTETNRAKNRRVEVVACNGAPADGKVILFYNPPVVYPEMDIRQNCLTATRKLATFLLWHKVSTIVFAHSRLNMEILVKYHKDAMESSFHSHGLVRGYSSGYLPW